MIKIIFEFFSKKTEFLEKEFEIQMPEQIVFKNQRLIAQSGLAKTFMVHWENEQSVKGAIINGKSHLHWNNGEK